MNVYRCLLPLLLACCACHAGTPVHARAGEPNSASAAGHDDRYVGTVTGRAGIAVVGRDRLELAHGTVYVNGQSYGRVPEVCEVRLEVGKNGKTLFVDGKVRNPPDTHRRPDNPGAVP